jgi:membrane glycosyltransferase
MSYLRYLCLFVGGLMSYLRYLCLFAHSGVQYILCCVFILFVFLFCILCCQFEGAIKNGRTIQRNWQINVREYRRGNQKWTDNT